MNQYDHEAEHRGDVCKACGETIRRTWKPPFWEHGKPPILIY